jgi:hypothetical protein
MTFFLNLSIALCAACFLALLGAMCIDVRAATVEWLAGLTILFLFVAFVLSLCRTEAQ